MKKKTITLREALKNKRFRRCLTAFGVLFILIIIISFIFLEEMRYLLLFFMPSIIILTKIAGNPNVIGIISSNPFKYMLLFFIIAALYFLCLSFLSVVSSKKYLRVNKFYFYYSLWFIIFWLVSNFIFFFFTTRMVYVAYQ